MGCRSSTPQAQAAAGARNKESDKLTSVIRCRVDSIRRRRNRVGDAITMEATLSFKMLIKDADADESSPANSIIPTSNSSIQNNTILSDNDDDKEEDKVDVNTDEMNNSTDKGKNVVVEAVLRAIDELLLAEEQREKLLNDGNSGVSKHAAAMNRQMYVPQSPSFRVYCTRLDSFDSCSTKDNNDHDDEAVKDIPKTKHGRCKSMDSASVMSNEEEEGSRKGKIEGQKGEITKKTVSNWKPLGVKNLFVMSCYSCSPHNRGRLLSRG